MKKVLVIVIIVLLAVGGYFAYKTIKENNRIEAIKKGWYIEMIYKDPVNIRKEANRFSAKIGDAKKGEVYKVLDVNTESKNLFWYNIELKDGTKAWIASNRSTPYVNDINNPLDISNPTIKFKNNIYSVRSIDDITYDHLTLWDDRDDFSVSHVVYHEVKPADNIDQYWIVYTITDAAGKSASKTQKIEFAIVPEESDVKDFNEYR